jgi:hypothetical protein
MEESTTLLKNGSDISNASLRVTSSSQAFPEIEICVLKFAVEIHDLTFAGTVFVQHVTLTVFNSSLCHPLGNSHYLLEISVDGL